MDIRWKQRFDNYKKALSQIKEGVDILESRDLNNLEKQGIIQAFEYTFELAWKTLKDFLEYKGNEGIMGSRDAIRLALSYGLINGDEWMKMIRSRNLTSHIYDEDEVEDIFEIIVNSYFYKFVELENKLKEFE